ncbi:MAG: hypothetical protein IJA73_00245 [Oscillospiraceae bacterium]|nr:hypothetical protein [Oscillospiraceae bacterium]
MKTTRLKNIVILTLVIANAFLMLRLVMRYHDMREVRESMVSEVVTLFASSGIALSRESVPDDIALDIIHLTRDTQRERALAEAVLGPTSAVNAGGGLYRYYNPNGTFLFRSNGVFECVASMEVDDAAAFCAQLCTAFGYAGMESTLDVHGTGKVTALRVSGSCGTVFNCTITFAFEKGVLTAVDGVYAPDGNAAAAIERPVSAVSALVKFLDYRNSTGVVCTEVSYMESGCLLQSGASAPMRLVPVWHIATPSGSFYVNQSNGEVSRG